MFTLDESKARAYIARALRRYASGVISFGPAAGDGTSEDVELAPGWNPREMIYGETWLADLIVEEAYRIGVITGPSEIQLIGAPDTDGGMYCWRIAGPGSRFAVCSPYFEEVRHIGDGRKGAHGALELLREATEAASELLAASAPLWAETA